MSSVPQPIETFAGGGTALACGAEGELRAEELHGLFAGDTRVLSTYRFAIAGHSWKPLSRQRLGPSGTQWDMQNLPIRFPGGELEAGSVHFRIRRQLRGALHDDLYIESFAALPAPVRLSILLDADFSDIFEVIDRNFRPRLGVMRASRRDGVSLRYERDGFARGLHATFTPSAGTMEVSGAQVVFDLVLEPHRPWTCCVNLVPELDGARVEFAGDPHAAFRVARRTPLRIRTTPLLAAPLRCGLADLQRLRMSLPDGPPFTAAGTPWFMALFGRDLLVTSLLAGIAGAWPARGGLEALGRLQAREEDPERDEEPGKIPHELRRGELAYQRKIPHTPYYGAHDAPELYALALWNAVRWSGDRALLERHLPVARAALDWCRTRGDRDGDGLLEYGTRSPRGYRNQSWKDSGVAIPHENGALAEPPIATVELQGYWFAALRAMAELEESWGAPGQARVLRAEAERLRERVEERFWLADQSFYALALDRDKRQVRSISSNPGHLLWCGLPSPARARQVADRLLSPAMFSGYGIRTLETRHVSYNPLSYQVGSVWPHDNGLAAAGMMRYGMREHAARVLEGILAAATAFEEKRLPELFCGFPRDAGIPVPYGKANSPQAWAAATPLLAAQLFLGLVPDAPRGCCHLDPWLPEWLPRLEVRGIRVGDGDLDVRLARRDGATAIESARHPSLEIRQGLPPAPLWGAV